MQNQKVELINEEVGSNVPLCAGATTFARESRARAQKRTPLVSQKDLKLNPFSLVATTAVRERFTEFVSSCGRGGVKEAKSMFSFGARLQSIN